MSRLNYTPAELDSSIANVFGALDAEKLDAVGALAIASALLLAVIHGCLQQPEGQLLPPDVLRFIPMLESLLKQVVPVITAPPERIEDALRLQRH